ncbi:LemA family protein [Thalassospira sp. HF15]|nr:LemA family protein [Thalassospira sp. HF15]
MVLVVVFVFLLVLLGYGVSLYNRLVSLRQAVQEGWSGIDVQLKRRSNLVPNLVETVKGYAAHEKELFEEVAELRAKTSAAGSENAQQRQELEGQLSTALMRIFAVSEAYPELRADETFIELQSALSELENKIQMARRYYNGTVREMNVAVQSFPSNFVAGSFGFVESSYYEVEHAIERQKPSVKFD